MQNEAPLPHADESHKVPSEYYKIIYDLKGNAASFLFDQDLPRKANYCEQKIRLLTKPFAGLLLFGIKGHYF